MVQELAPLEGKPPQETKFMVDTIFAKLSQLVILTEINNFLLLKNTLQIYIGNLISENFNLGLKFFLGVTQNIMGRRK